MLTQLKWKIWKVIKIQKRAFRYRRSLSKLQTSDYIKVLHYDIPNWGDAINPTLVEFISRKETLSVDIDYRSSLPAPVKESPDSLYLNVGSIVHHADCHTEIWGAGLQAAHLKPRQVPKRIHAVRGPLTAKALRQHGLDCPDIYGDPVLLLPKYYPSRRNIKYKLGVVAHRKDAMNENIRELSKREDVLFINMRDTSMNLVDRLNQCELITSTSLHGLILADAYGIPNAWGRASEKIPGGYFKYKDYYSSIGHDQSEPDIFFNGEASLEKICSSATKKELLLDLDLLLESCPFN